MSGRKVSKFALDSERQEKLRLIRETKRLRPQIKALQKGIAETLRRATPGLLSTFASQVAQAEEWMRARASEKGPELGMDEPNSVLRDAVTRLEGIAQEGRQIQAQLAAAFTEKADAMAGRLAAQLASAEILCIEHEPFLRDWFGDQAAEYRRVLQEASRLYRAQQYGKTDEALAGFEAAFAARLDLAQVQEEKHQKRLYLLKALRQVCAELGFEEVSAPRFEQENERGSAILFAVDTVNQGQIAFTLSLEGIATNSEVAGHRCADEFCTLSRYLEEEFGVQTDFRLADGEPLPRLRHKGEKDLPGDASKEAKA
ncbi:MAG: cysteine desulfurase [Chloroflexi bacterium]|nr:cysteine desulfurase [Chloroflexota bacterium]